MFLKQTLIRCHCRCEQVTLVDNLQLFRLDLLFIFYTFCICICIAWSPALKGIVHGTAIMANKYSLINTFSAICSIVAGQGAILVSVCVLRQPMMDAALPHGTAPTCLLAANIRRTANVEGRRHLHSFDMTTLAVLSTHRSTLGHRAFPSWRRNTLPASVRTAPSVIFSNYRYLPTAYWRHFQAVKS